jgi:iron(III) transport system substrate-binding protein
MLRSSSLNPSGLAQANSFNNVYSVGVETESITRFGFGGIGSTSTSSGRLLMNKPFAVVYSFLMAIVLTSPSSWSQGIDDSKVIEGAKREGEIVWYTITAADPSKAIVDSFQRKYPFIRPVHVRAGGGPLLNKIFAESKAGRKSWDVLVGRGEMFPSLMAKKFLAPYRSPEIKMIDDDLVEKAGYWVAYNLQTWVLGYNTNLVKKEDIPRTYDALLDPKWRGEKISVDTEAHGWFQGLRDAWGSAKTVTYFERLASQNPALKRGNTLRVQLTAAGEHPLNINLNSLIHRLYSKGAPIDWVALEPAVVRILPVMLAADAPHPNAAKLFIDFVLSKEGQGILTGFGDIPVRRDVDPDPPRLIRGYKRVIERPEGYENLKETIELYSNIFKRR